MTEHTFKEEQAGYIDFYHGKRLAEGNPTAPVFEGRLKLLRSLKKGEEVRFAVWTKTKEGVTGGEMFSGKLTVSVAE